MVILVIMNEQERQQKKDSILKSLAIIGFIGTILVIAWLSITLVHLAPSAFSSLASLAETLNQKRQDLAATESEEWSLALKTDTTLITPSDPVEISWNQATSGGYFTFSYACADGVAVDLIGVTGLGSIACDTNYNLGNATSLSFTVDSEKNRYADMAYTIAFMGSNDTVARTSETRQVTIINNSLADGDASPEPIPTVPTPEITPSVPTPAPEVVVTPTKPSTPAPAYTEEIIYITPVSDPNGRVDLGVRFLGTGTIVNNRFVPGTISLENNGAIQFEVKNYGTKTSGLWNLTVSLPDGSQYEAKAEAALKPNERATMTIGFAKTSKTTHTFLISVQTDNEQYLLNNSLQQLVRFVK